MANPKHVELLKQGVDVWNKWREENQDIRPNLCGVDIRKEQIKGTSLQVEGVNGAYLESINFSNTDLTSAHLEGCDASLSNFLGATLHGVHFNKACLHRANFERAFCRFSEFINADLKGANFSDADVKGIIFNKSSLQKNFQSIRVSTCYGSQRFKTFAQDQDFIEEFRDSGRWGAFLFWVWWLLANCGRSFWPWACWSAAMALVFAAVFFFGLGPGHFHINSELPASFSTMIYYSVVTFTTLGFGDLTPATTAAAWCVVAEVILGYIMLGGLISILANKLARRS
jgi:hypothetical protein